MEKQFLWLHSKWLCDMCTTTFAICIENTSGTQYTVGIGLSSSFVSIRKESIRPQSYAQDWIWAQHYKTKLKAAKKL